MSVEPRNLKVQTSRRNFLQGTAAAVTGAGILASASSISQANAGPATGDPIPLGAAVPLTGWAAADGIEYQPLIRLPRRRFTERSRGRKADG